MKSNYEPEDVEIVVFDLDKTLIYQDSLLEQIKALFKFSKLNFFHSLWLLILHGRVLFKKRVFQLNENFDNNSQSLTNIKVNKIVQKEFDTHKKRGNKVIVATAAYEKTAIKILQKINLVPDILIATKNGKNLKGELKLEALNPHIKNIKWAYYGDSNADIPLFKSASFAYKVNGSSIVKIDKI